MDAGGFDVRFRIAAEDAMITRAMHEKGWSFAVNPDAWVYHAARSSWKGLWKEYFWWGFGAFMVRERFPHTVRPWRFYPPMALASGIVNALRAAKYTGSAASLIIPIHYLYKRTAWTYGYLKARRSLR